MALTELDLEIPGDVTELLAEFGVDADFTSKKTGQISGDGSVVAGSTTSYSGIKAVAPYGVGQRIRNQLASVGGGLSERVIALTLISGENTFVPTVGWHVTFSSTGRTYYIEHVTPYRSGELVAAYEIGLSG